MDSLRFQVTFGNGGGKMIHEVDSSSRPMTMYNLGDLVEP